MRKFFVKITNDKVIFLSNDEKHLKVLRVKKDKIIKCFDKDTGAILDVKVINTNPYEGVVINKIDNPKIEPYNITCYLGVIKKNNFEWAIEKLNELNIYKTVPVYFNYSQQNIFLNMERLNKMIDESCKQSNRFEKMILDNPKKFNEILKELSAYDLVLYAYENEKTLTFSNIISKKENKYNKIAFIVGPEGGFSETEINELKKIGNSIKLTNTILKTETAAIYCASVIIERFYNEN